MNKIEIGDIVDVSFTGQGLITNIKILYMPQDVGDSWRGELADGTPCNFIIFELMVRHR